MSEKLAAACIGIDLGSWTSKICVAKRGGVEVITNEANFRQTPSVVGFGPAQRNIGQAGNIKMKSNFRDTIVSPMRYLGLDGHYPLLKAQTKYCPARTTINHGRLLFEVNYQGQNEQFTAQQIAGAYFNKLKSIIARNGLENKQAVIAVPTYLTQRQRKAFLDAAKVAQLNITRLLNDSTAIALDYGMFRKADLDSNPRNVLFIDFGHAKFGTFTCSFTKEQMNVLQQEYCRNLGCRDIDYHMFQFYRGVFQKSSGNDLSENRKAVVKIMEYIEKQRKILSGNIQHELNVECLMNDSDLQYTMTRDEFEKITQPIFQQIRNVLIKTHQTLQSKNIQLHSIQLVGSGTRIPYLINLVKQVFKMDASRTLNSSQSVARGCALMAAIKSPLFKVPDYTLNEKMCYGVKLLWNFVQNNHHLGINPSHYPQKQIKMIFESGCKIPTSKSIKFTRKEAIQILIEYQPALIGFPKNISYFLTQSQNPKHQNFGVSFKLKINENGIISFQQCNLVEEWTEQTKIPKKKQDKKQEKKEDKKQEKKEQNKDPSMQAPESMDIEQPKQEQEFEIKTTKKEHYTVVKYEQNTYELNSQKDIQQYFSFESTMMNQDKHIIETYEKKNQLQSTIYSWKQKLNGTHREFIKQDEVAVVLNFLEENNEWLYGEGQNSNRGTYVNKINGIKDKVDPIQKRYDSYHRILQEGQNLSRILKQNFDFVNSLDQKYSHISAEDRQQVINLIQRVQTWLNHESQKVSSTAKWQDLPLKAQDIQKHAKQIIEKAKQVMSKPPPKPQPQQQKPSEPKKETSQKMDVQTEDKK